MSNSLPILYSIKIAPNISESKFKGTTIVHYFFDEYTNEVNLNYNDLEIEKIRIHPEETELSYTLDPENNMIHISLGEEFHGQFAIVISYTGKIRDGITGLYKSNFVFKQKEYTLIMTQCFEEEAMSIFPCIDNPMNKTIFNLELIIEDHLDAYSNEGIQEINYLDNKLKQVIFKSTPKMSSYLFFFIIGKLEHIEDKSAGLPIRIVSTPMQATQYGKFSLDFAIKSFNFCKSFFNVEYPLSKLDLITTKDFVYGGMENFGAIVIKENLLFRYPTTPTNQINGIKQIIAHEISHQWFGDLVTPSDFKYIWLNESFAIYFAYQTMSEIEPEYPHWEDFLLEQTKVALTADGRLNTVSIELPSNERVSLNIKSAPIIYNKGATIIRQLASFMTPISFQEGLKQYFKKHKFSNAKSEDLWNSLNRITDVSIIDFMKSWVLQEGYPVVKAVRIDNRVQLSQSRFSYLPNNSTQNWHIPMQAKIYDKNKVVQEIQMPMSETELSFIVKEDHIFKINPDFIGFYRTHYQKEELDKLGPLIKNKILSPIDRWSIENDIYSLVKANTSNLLDYLDLLQHYDVEDSRLVLNDIKDNLHELYLFTEGESLELVIQKGRLFFDKILSQFDLNGIIDSQGNSTFIELLYISALFGVEKSINFGIKNFNELVGGSEISNEIKPVVIKIGAHVTNEIDWFKEKIRNAKNEAEKLTYIEGLCCISDKQKISEVKTFIIDEIADSSKLNTIKYFAKNKYADNLWNWFKENDEKIGKLHPMHYQGILGHLVPRDINNLDDIQIQKEQIIKERPYISDLFEILIEKLQININLSNL
ncbi:MAG: M1 family metallopeptidase [Candidatus Heimdallarchaeota archaeon]|nr:M1 family metallopeptidase [Candidatus Heimdallarchaeota archaeon]